MMVVSFIGMGSDWIEDMARQQAYVSAPETAEAQLALAGWPARNYLEIHAKAANESFLFVLFALSSLLRSLVLAGRFLSSARVIGLRRHIC
jgi:hypothetical protein